MNCYIRFVEYLVLREDLRELFCVCNFAGYVLGILKFKLSLITSDNTQVSIYGALRPGIAVARASVT